MLSWFAGLELCQSIYSNNDSRASSKVIKEIQYGDVIKIKDKVTMRIFLNLIFLFIKIILIREIAKDIIPTSFERKLRPEVIPIP